MIKHPLFSKGDQIHALISTTHKPDILFPVRATIYDVKFHDINPQYQIRIKKFYDDIYFLKKNMFGGRFIKNFEGKDTKINLKRGNYSTIEDVENLIFNGDKWKQYLILVDSVFCVRTRAEQLDLFSKIQTFHIELKLKELFELANRSNYKGGRYYWHTKGEYIKSLEKFLGNRYDDSDKWAENLLYRPETDEMDDVEWV
tara:strand:- start:39210 stop:39809 length:600 start_codon:yes stop_codon:yes gene_type:complete